MPNIITIDGPASSGKSSVGHLFSHKINYLYIDTGVIYRCYGYFALKNNLLDEPEEKLAEIFENLKIEFKKDDNKDLVFLNSENVTEFIHTPEVSKTTPKIAALAKVREVSKALQRKIGESQNTVMAGRDIGSEIFPESKLKFFITASAKVRAQRRFDQLIKKFPDTKFEEVLEDTKKRDQADSTRSASPLRIPKGAVVVDTSKKSIEQSVEILLENYKKVFTL